MGLTRLWTPAECDHAVRALHKALKIVDDQPALTRYIRGPAVTYGDIALGLRMH